MSASSGLAIISVGLGVAAITNFVVQFGHIEHTTSVLGGGTVVIGAAYMLRLQREGKA